MFFLQSWIQALHARHPKPGGRPQLSLQVQGDPAELTQLRHKAPVECGQPHQRLPARDGQRSGPPQRRQHRIAAQLRLHETVRVQEGLPQTDGDEVSAAGEQRVHSVQFPGAEQLRDIVRRPTPCRRKVKTINVSHYSYSVHGYFNRCNFNTFYTNYRKKSRIAKM